MGKPIVAIIGKPNVGKSTLFNALSGSYRSIVDERPGVTRDRIYADSEWGAYSFTLIDTGGIEPEKGDDLLIKMQDQAEIAIETADVIVFLLDLKTGLKDVDLKVADILRRARKPVLVCVNKVDNYQKQANDVYEFYELGMGDPIPISATNKQGLGDLLDEIVRFFDTKNEDEEIDTTTKIAIAGHPNVGKSSLINRLTGTSRMIVSDLAGTTRDAVDSRVRYNGAEYIFIDTAGLRRKSRIKDDLERYAYIRALAAIDRCDIAVIMLDAPEGVTDQDVRIAGIAHDKGKGVLIFVNKWDIFPEKDDKSIYRFTRDIRDKMSFMSYAEILFASVKTGQRVFKIYEKIDKIRQNQTLRIKSGILNEVLIDAMSTHEPPISKGRMLKIFYATQVSVEPPTFVFFVNSKELFHFSYMRYIENNFREAFGFYGTPVKFIVRERNYDTG